MPGERFWLCFNRENPPETCYLWLASQALALALAVDPSPKAPQSNTLGHPPTAGLIFQMILWGSLTLTPGDGCSNIMVWM